MNEAQTLFSIFYGFYFAATIPLTGVFSPFDTPQMAARNGRAWLRFVVSFLSLNVLPLIYFVWVYAWLGECDFAQLKIEFTVAGGSAMGRILFLSLVGFGIYRVFCGLMLLRWGGKWMCYGEELPKKLSEELDVRGEPHKVAWSHWVPGVLWVLVCLGMGVLLICGRIWITLSLVGVLLGMGALFIKK